MLIRSQTIPALTLAFGVASVAAIFASGPPAMRAAFALPFLVTAPGWAIVRFLGLDDPLAEFTLAVALSISIAIAVATITVYAGGWSPRFSYAAIAAVTVLLTGVGEGRLLYDRYGGRGRVRGSQDFDEALGEAQPSELVRGENVHTDVELRSFEAEKGTRRIVGFSAVALCTACMGRGSVGLPDPECDYVAEPCARCGGKGTVLTVRRIRVLIPPGIEDGTLLRVSGDGNDAGAGSVPGDLLVRVHLLPPPKDPSLVRYIAFALWLVAIATLVLYVVR